MAVIPFKFKPECNQSEDDSEGPNRDPPDDNLGSMDASVGRSDRVYVQTAFPCLLQGRRSVVKRHDFLHSFHR